MDPSKRSRVRAERSRKVERKSGRTLLGRATRAPLLGCGAASCHSRGIDIYIYLSYGGHLPLRRAFLAPNRARAPDKNGAACAGSDSGYWYMHDSMHLGSISWLDRLFVGSDLVRTCTSRSTTVTPCMHARDCRVLACCQKDELASWFCHSRQDNETP